MPSRFPAAPVQRRWNSSRDVQDLPPEEEPKGPTQDQLPHVSEEAAEISRIMNKDKEKQCDGTPSTPELEQGTPVSEVSGLFLWEFCLEIFLCGFGSRLG